MVEFPFDLVYNGKSFVYGENNPGANGGFVVPLNVRFFISDVVLSRSGADPVPVDIVGADSKPVPYGIYFFNAEELESHTMRVLAPAGSYTGMTFVLGLTDACNRGNSSRHDPLTDASQMYWGGPLGYLFLRYEGRNSLAEQTSPPPVEIHMGGLPGSLFAPLMRVEGSLTVPEAGGASASKAVHLVMDQVFLGATTEIDPPNGDPGVRLLKNAAHLPLFVFGS